MFIIFKGEERLSSNQGTLEHLFNKEWDALINGFGDTVGFSIFDIDSYPIITSVVFTENPDLAFVENNYRNTLKAKFKDISHNVKMVYIKDICTSLNKDISLPFISTEEQNYIDIKQKSMGIQLTVLSLGNTAYNFNCNLNLTTTNPHLLKDKLKKWLRDDVSMRHCISETLSSYHQFKMNCSYDLNLTLPCNFLRSSFNHYKTFIKYANHDKLMEYINSFSPEEKSRARERYIFLQKIKNPKPLNFKGISLSPNSNGHHYIQILGTRCTTIEYINFHIFESLLKMVDSYDDYESSLESLKLLNC